MTYYDVLGLRPDSTQKQIREAFTRLVKQHHPDHGGDAKKFNLIYEAYNVLKSSESRRRYDESLRWNQSQQSQSQQSQSQQSQSQQSGSDAVKWISRNRLVSCAIFVLCVLPIVFYLQSETVSRTVSALVAQTQADQNTITHLKAELKAVSGKTDALSQEVSSQNKKISSSILSNPSVHTSQFQTPSNNSSAHASQVQSPSNNPDTFTIGSTEQQVKSVMGVPTSIISSPIGDTWMYDFSSVDFDTSGRVKGWNNASNNLKLH